MSGQLTAEGLAALLERNPSHAELYLARGNAPAELQAKLAPLEHQAFAREWTQDNPLLAAPSLAVAIPAYTAAKALGLTGARSPASLAEMLAAYRGIWQGLRGRV